jgi:hypothetical protein
MASLSDSLELEGSLASGHAAAKECWGFWRLATGSLGRKRCRPAANDTTLVDPGSLSQSRVRPDFLFKTKKSTMRLSTPRTRKANRSSSIREPRERAVHRPTQLPRATMNHGFTRAHGENPLPCLGSTPARGYGLTTTRRSSTVLVGPEFVTVLCLVGLLAERQSSPPTPF